MDLSGSTFQPCHRLWSNGMDMARFRASRASLAVTKPRPRAMASNGMNPSGTLPPKLIRRCWSQNQSNVFKGVCPKHSLSPHRKTWKNLVSPQNWRSEVGLLKTWTVTPTKFCNGCLSSQWQRENMQKLQYPNSIRKKVSSGHCIWSFWWTCWEKKLLKSPNNAPPDRGPGHGPCDFFSALGTTTGLQKFWIKVWGLEKKD